MDIESSPPIATTRERAKKPLPAPRNHLEPPPAPPSPTDGYAPPEQDSYSATALSEVMDRSVRAMTARMTMGLSPEAIMAVWTDWGLHMLGSPGKQLRLF